MGSKAESNKEIPDVSSQNQLQLSLKLQTKGTTIENKPKTNITTSYSIDGSKPRDIDEKEEEETKTISKQISVNNIGKGRLMKSVEKMIIKKNKTNNLYNLSTVNFNKTLSDKNKALIDSYLVKYKQFCINFIKDNEEIKKLVQSCMINNLEQFLDDFVFENKVFQYKAEQMFLKNDGSKNNKEKVN